MEITRWKKRDSRGEMVRVTPTEAVRIINSLTNQLLNKSPNSGRAEFDTDLGYFSISIHPHAGKQDAIHIAERALAMAKWLPKKFGPQFKKALSSELKQIEEDLKKVIGSGYWGV